MYREGVIHKEIALSLASHQQADLFMTARL